MFDSDLVSARDRNFEFEILNTLQVNKSEIEHPKSQIKKEVPYGTSFSIIIFIGWANC